MSVDTASSHHLHERLPARRHATLPPGSSKSNCFVAQYLPVSAQLGVKDFLTTQSNRWLSNGLSSHDLCYCWRVQGLLISSTSTIWHYGLLVHPRSWADKVGLQHNSNV
eukprot:2126322-Amphidinium_carterae.1